jgi:excinuclease ABC subunit A
MPKTNSETAEKPLQEIDSRNNIIIKGARVNNLKNIDVVIPRNQLIVISGLSGSGKSSLAFDTLFAEGQRMYVESLSSYARQFLSRMDKPEVDFIKGVSPAIAIEQKVNTKNPRSTVGTSTEIYDYLKLLFARIGKTISPVSGNEVKKNTVTDVVDFINSNENGTRFYVLAPLQLHKTRTIEHELSILLQKGYSRIYNEGNILEIEELVADKKSISTIKNSVYTLIDRIAVNKEDEDTLFRLSDSVQTAFFEGDGYCVIASVKGEMNTFSDRFELDGIQFEEPNVNFFSFNNPYGACKTCEGFGHVLGIDPDLVIPNKSLSIYEEAIAPWRGPSMSEWLRPLLKKGIEFDFPIHRPFNELTEKEQNLLWTGNKHFEGLNAFFKYLETQTHKIQYRVMLSRYRGRTVCPDCLGTRLRKDAGYVKINQKSIQELLLLPVDECLEFFNTIKLSSFDEKVAKRLLTEIQNRLSYLCDVGLGYLTLNRLSSTLSGGESQRINLATCLGSALVGSMYILDEPSIGLHPRDTDRLIKVLKTLRDLGNTVIVVEHDEEIIRTADYLIDIGPDAGSMGGEVVFSGKISNLKGVKNSHTANFLNGLDTIDTPKVRRNWSNYIEVKGARENNLKNISVKIPLNTITAITGVSGSGKSTLLKRIVHPALMRKFDGVADLPGKFDSISGDIESLSNIEFIDQNPIGKSSRSNPVTYTKAYDYIRQVFADTPLAKAKGLKPAHFSFNVDGGRCEVCQGEGTVKIEMQFMADLYLKCDHCHGKRFKQEILEVKYQEKDISDILELTIEDSLYFFRNEAKILEKIQPLKEVGLGYVRLGQSSNTLSGGEAQRIKLATYLTKGATKEPILFIFDEPTTGLHHHDIKKLLKALNGLVEIGHSVIIIEHNLDMIKSADWVIDMGPEAGDMGGNIVFAGVPENLIKCKESYTGKYLKEKL